MIRIVKGKVSESQQLREFEAKVWKGEASNEIDMGFFVRFGYVFLAKEGDKIVGAIIGMRTKENKVNIADWIVDENYRRQGIGLHLYNRLKKEIGNLNIVAFVKADKEPSINAHLKLGFKKIKKLKDPFYLGDGSHWWHLELEPHILST